MGTRILKTRIVEASKDIWFDTTWDLACMNPKGSTELDIWNEQDDPMMGTFRVGDNYYLFYATLHEGHGYRMNFKFTMFDPRDDPDNFRSTRQMEKWIRRYQKDKQYLSVMASGNLMSRCLVL
jgi:hypothetical protein